MGEGRININMTIYRIASTGAIVIIDRFGYFGGRAFSITPETEQRPFYTIKMHSFAVRGAENHASATR